MCRDTSDDHIYCFSLWCLASDGDMAKCIFYFVFLFLNFFLLLLLLLLSFCIRKGCSPFFSFLLLLLLMLLSLLLSVTSYRSLNLIRIKAVVVSFFWSHYLHNTHIHPPTLSPSLPPSLPPSLNRHHIRI